MIEQRMHELRDELEALEEGIIMPSEFYGDPMDETIADDTTRGIFSEPKWLMLG